MLALEKRAPKLVEEIREHAFPTNIDFLTSMSNDIVMCYEGMPLHSLDNPIAEAETVYKSVKFTGTNTINILFGLGLGYLFKRATMECSGTIIVYEPHIDILRATMEAVDFSEELAKEEIYIIKDIKTLREVFNKNFYKGDYVGVQTLTSYRITFPDLLKELMDEAKNLYRDSLINQNTMLNKAKNWSIASLNNLTDILMAPNRWVIKDRLTDVPVVVVSAGPSLDHAIETLKQIQDKVFIVAVGQALKTLDKHGIKPHLVEVIENLNVSQQFTGVSYLEDITIVVQPMTHRSIYKLPAKRFMINFPKGDNISKWFGNIVDRGVEGYPNRGSVSFCAYYTAFNSGANPIILVGQDLAFRDGKCYASGSSYEKIKYEVGENGKLNYSYNEETYNEIGKTFEISKEEFLNRANICARDTIIVKGWDDEDLYTSVSYSVFLNNYKDMARNEIPQTERRVINASYGGAKIEGLEHLKFDEAIKSCNLDHGVDINQVLNDIFNDFEVTDKLKRKFVNAVNKTLSDLKRASKIAKESIEIAGKIEEGLKQSFINETYIDNLIISLGKNDKKMIKIVKETTLINPFINSELFEYSRGFNRESRQMDPDKKIENLKANIEQSIRLYEAIIKGSNDIHEVLPQMLEENKDILSFDIHPKGKKGKKVNNA